MASSNSLFSSKLYISIAICVPVNLKITSCSVARQLQHISGRYHILVLQPRECLLLLFKRCWAKATLWSLLGNWSGMSLLLGITLAVGLPGDPFIESWSEGGACCGTSSFFSSLCSSSSDSSGFDWYVFPLHRVGWIKKNKHFNHWNVTKWERHTATLAFPDGSGTKLTGSFFCLTLDSLCWESAFSSCKPTEERQQPPQLTIRQ